MLTARREVSEIPPQKTKPAYNLVPLVDYHRMVEETAYYLAEKRGFEAGHELSDWLQAERIVDAKLRERRF